MFFSSHTAPSRNISADKLFITFLSVFCFPGRFSEVKLAHDQHMMTLYDVKNATANTLVWQPCIKEADQINKSAHQ